jgi:hypothetical protein
MTKEVSNVTRNLMNNFSGKMVGIMLNTCRIGHGVSNDDKVSAV